MAAPTLQAEGTVAAVTSGNLTVTLPAHQTNDILIVTLQGWVPNTVGSAAGVTAPTGWTEASETPTPSGTADGQVGLYWRRAASGSETNPTFVRPTGWDTGTDTAWAGRAYVVRGVDPNAATPWDALVASALFTTASQAFSAVTVSGMERTVIHFGIKQDDNAWGTAPAGWTAGLAGTSSTGTDSGFQTYRQENVSSNTSSAAPSGTAAPIQGNYQFIGISFQPVPVTNSTGSGSPVATLSATASGTAVLKFNASGSPVKTLSSTASGTAVLKFNASGSPVKTLSATASGSGTMTPPAGPPPVSGSGSPVATLSKTASGAAVETFNASGSPIKTLSATASGTAVQRFTASGAPSKTLSTSATGSATLKFNASGASARRLSATATGTALNPHGGVATPKKKARGYIIETEQPEPYREPEPTPITVIEATPLPDAPEIGGYERVQPQKLQLEPIRWNPRTNRPAPVDDVVVEEIDEDEEILLQILSII